MIVLRKGRATDCARGPVALSPEDGGHLLQPGRVNSSQGIEFSLLSFFFGLQAAAENVGMLAVGGLARKLQANSIGIEK